MTTLRYDLVKFWFEFRGRRRPAPQFAFSVHEIYSPGEIRNVSSLTNALYINLHPTLYAVATLSDGKILNLKGGFNYPLVPGRYVVHYVDKQNRVSVVPKVLGTTTDGLQVSLELVITYRVSDPIRALEVQQPVENLFVLIQSDLKEFIRSHSYAEIFEGSDEHKVDGTLFARYLRERHNSRHQMSRLFFIADVVVNEKIGDPKLTEIKENFQVQQRQNIASGELKKLNQELEKQVASQEAQIKQIKAKSEADQQEIVQKMKMQGLEFERARAELQAELQYRQETMTQAMNAIGQALSASTYPLDAHAMEIIRSIISEFRGQTNPEAIPDVSRKGATEPQQLGTFNVERVGTLTETLLNWLNYKR